MRFLALETNVEVMKKKLVAEGEQAVFVAHHHAFEFIASIWWQTIVSAIIIAGLPLIVVPEWLALIVLATVAAWFLIYAYAFFAAYVQWKYNFIIITTQKVVIVEQRSLFHQEVHPLHFSTIRNVRTKSQLFGFFRCGILFINLAVPEQGGSVIEREIPYLSKPEDIAAIIENGLITTKKPLEEHEEMKKKEVMQEPVLTVDNPEPETLPEQQ